MSKKFVTYDSKHFIKFGTRKINIMLIYNMRSSQIGFTTSQSQNMIKSQKT